MDAVSTSAASLPGRRADTPRVTIAAPLPPPSSSSSGTSSSSSSSFSTPGARVSPSLGGLPSQQKTDTHGVQLSLPPSVPQHQHSFGDIHLERSPPLPHVEHTLNASGSQPLPPLSSSETIVRARKPRLTSDESTSSRSLTPHSQSQSQYPSHSHSQKSSRRQADATDASPITNGHMTDDSDPGAKCEASWSGAHPPSHSHSHSQPTDHDMMLATKAVDEVAEKFEQLLKLVPVPLTSDHLRTLRAKVNQTVDHVLDDTALDPIVNATIHDAPITCSGLVKDVWGRVSWLAGLLLLQSSSSFILERFSKLIETHLIVTFFLTMLVGAGGNAGNQSAVMVIRGLATGTVRDDNKYKILWRQLLTGFLMSLILVCFGYFRVVLFGSDVLSAVAISLSLFFIVVVSVIAGTLLPLGLDAIGLDPAHAGPTIQVFMDILGVYITCVVCSAMFAAPAMMTPAPASLSSHIHQTNNVNAAVVGLSLPGPVPFASAHTMSAKAVVANSNMNGGLVGNPHVDYLPSFAHDYARHQHSDSMDADAEGSRSPRLSRRFKRGAAASVSVSSPRRRLRKHPQAHSAAQSGSIKSAAASAAAALDSPSSVTTRATARGGAIAVPPAVPSLPSSKGARPDRVGQSGASKELDFDLREIKRMRIRQREEDDARLEREAIAAAVASPLEANGSTESSSAPPSALPQSSPDHGADTDKAHLPHAARQPPTQISLGELDAHQENFQLPSKSTEEQLDDLGLVQLRGPRDWSEIAHAQSANRNTADAGSTRANTPVRKIARTIARPLDRLD